MDDHYRRTDKSIANKGNTNNPQKDIELDDFAQEDSFEQILTSKGKPRKQTKTKKKTLKEPLLQGYTLDEENKGDKILMEELKDAPSSRKQEDWTTLPPAYVIDHAEEKKKGCTKYFHVRHYTKYFDVTTKEVIMRVLRSIFPIFPGSVYPEGKIIFHLFMFFLTMS
jgi:hypothetical protein